MPINVRFYGGIKKALPKDMRRTHTVHARNFREIINYCEQFYSLREYLKQGNLDVRVGPDLTTARYLTELEAREGRIPNGATVHIVPNVQGAITAAVLVTALVSAAISIAVTLLASLLFPNSTPKADTRKNALYSNGLQSNKEGVALPYLAGLRVFSGGNVIEGDYDYSSSGGSSSYVGIDSLSSSLGIGLGLLKNGGYAGAVATDSSAVQAGITSFKGKGGGSTISNTTYSDAVIRFAMATGSGEIGGIAGSDGLSKSKNIYINQVPLIDPGTGQPNYRGISWEERFGVTGQAALKLTPGTSDSFNAGISLTKAVTAAQLDDNGNVTVPAGTQLYIPKTVSGPNINRVKLDFRINELVSTSKKGNQSETGVTFAADVKRASDSAWTPAGSWEVYEKSSQAFDRQYTIYAPTNADQDVDPWLFRVYRVTADSTSDTLQNSTTFQGWVEIIDKTYLYDGSEGVGFVPTSLFAAAIDMASFNVQDKPEFALILQGRKVRVPDVYDPVARTYSGVWNGAWKYASTENPVWHFLEIATDKEVGCGYPDSFFDPMDLLASAKRCDEVINGRFRYSLNKQFTDQQDGWSALQDLAHTFRAWPYYSGRNIVLVQDRPGSPDHFINNSHVENGKFTYATVPAENQYNEMIVQWDNPDDYYRVASEKYQDTNNIALLQKKGIANNGIVTKTVYKTGCTNRQEAYDYARALVWSAVNENVTLSFNTSINANAYAPGQRILTDDWNITGKEWTGRITSVGSGTLTLDVPIDWKANTPYDALMIVNNGMVRRSINQFGSTTKTAAISIDTDGIVTDTPISIIENTSTAPQPLEWRITDIQETDQGMFQVNAVRHIEGKFAFIDNNVPVTFIPWSQVQTVTPTPTNMVFNTYSYIDDILGPRHGIDIAWDKVISDPQGSNQGLALAGYTLEVTLPNSSTWTQIYKGTDNFCSLTNCDPGQYSFSLRSLSILGKSSAANIEQYTMGSNATAALTAPVFDGAN